MPRYELSVINNDLTEVPVVRGLINTIEVDVGKIKVQTKNISPDQARMVVDLLALAGVGEVGVSVFGRKGGGNKIGR